MSAAILFIGFVLAIALVARAAGVVMIGRVAKWVRVLYFAFVVATAIAAYFTTFRYTYYYNPNTRVHGWPIPFVVFQRDSAADPWLDFVGITSVLAYPMNLLLFNLLPSIAVLVLLRRAQPKGGASVEETTRKESA